MLPEVEFLNIPKNTQKPNIMKEKDHGLFHVKLPFHVPLKMKLIKLKPKP
jgi:hypothetical protein